MELPGALLQPLLKPLSLAQLTLALQIQAGPWGSPVSLTTRMVSSL